MATLLEYKCPNCSGAITFNSSSGQMQCPYCDASFDVETLRAYDDELKNQRAEAMDWELGQENRWTAEETDGMSVYSCESCGGEIVGDENTAATRCPYCDNPVVMTGQFSGDLRPSCIIPFKLDKQAAKDALSKHLQGKRLLPKIFKDQNHIDEIKGIYVPFWLFDAEVDAAVRYRATTLRSWSDSEYNYIETSHFAVMREGAVAFTQVPVDGSSKMADDLMESIEPYSYKDAVDFQTAYLAGYLADKYDVDAEQSVKRANDRVRTSTERVFKETVQGYSSVTTESSNIRLSSGKVKYALLPVWILNTTWNGTRYVFAMNGQTGKFVGNLPMDKGAFWRWFAGVTAAVSAVAFAVQMIYSMM